MLDAAERELVDRGAAGLTMAGVARRAGASKGTLYSWFTDRDGLLAALVERAADRAGEQVRRAIVADLDADPRAVLLDLGRALLTLLTGNVSVALNRAATSSAGLAGTLLAGGRYRIGPLVEAYLDRLHRAGRLHVPDPPAAFRLFYGMVVQDSQITVLLGAPRPTPAEVDRQAGSAVDAFLRLHAVR